MTPLQININIKVGGTIHIVHTFDQANDTKADTLAAVQKIDDAILAAKAKADTTTGNPTAVATNS